MINILYKFLLRLFWSLNLKVKHEMLDFYQEFFFSSFVFIYVTIQDRGDIIGYYYSTLGNSFVPCFSCRKQQENNMFVCFVTKQLQKTTTLFSCRKHKKQQEWNRRAQPMFKSISVWLLRLKKWMDIKQKEKFEKLWLLEFIMEFVWKTK